MNKLKSKLLYYFNVKLCLDYDEVTDYLNSLSDNEIIQISKRRLK